MNRIVVSSTNLQSIGYENEILEVEFRNGRIYQYFNVPKHIYQGLLSAASKGTYLDRYIKKAGFSYVKISP